MRKVILSLAVLAGGVVAASASQATPALRAPVLDTPSAHVQTVQYAPGWREREYWRARRHQEARRRHAWRRHEAWRERHAYGAPPPRVWARPY